MVNATRIAVRRNKKGARDGKGRCARGGEENRAGGASIVSARNWVATIYASVTGETGVVWGGVRSQGPAWITMPRVCHMWQTLDSTRHWRMITNAIPAARCNIISTFAFKWPQPKNEIELHFQIFSDAHTHSHTTTHTHTCVWINFVLNAVLSFVCDTISIESLLWRHICSKNRSSNLQQPPQETAEHQRQ